MRGPFVVAVVVLVVMAGVSVIVLAGHAWDPMAFVLPRPVDVPHTQTWGIGYDGRFAYAIALGPYGSAQGLDVPAYRYMRIVYPLTAWAIALGQRALVPWTMLGVNLAAAAVSAAILGSMACRRGASAAAALVLILSFNYFIGLRLDLNEPVAFALALVGLYAYERDRLPAAVAAFAAAGLAKEVSLALPLGLAAWLLLSRRWKTALLLVVGCVGPYLAWGVVVGLWLGNMPFGSLLGAPTFPPFIGLRSVAGLETRIMVLLWVVGPAILAGLGALWQILRTPRSEASRDAAMVLVNAGVIASLPVLTWVDPLAVLRMAIGLMIAIVLWLSGTRPRLLALAFALWAPSLLLAFLIPGFLT